MTGTTCIWCNCNPRAAMPNNISPHSTWCPRYTAPPPVDFSLLPEFPETDDGTEDLPGLPLS